MARKSKETAPFPRRIFPLPDKMERGWPFDPPVPRGGEPWYRPAERTEY